MPNSKASGGAATEDDAVPNCCKICGDSAGCGVNFGCLSCESCKAFFRRCSVRAQSLKCPFSGNCRITKASRRACQFCRLAKCVKIWNGMCKELVDVWKRARAKKTTIVDRMDIGIGIERGRHNQWQNRGKDDGKVRRRCCKCECGANIRTQTTTEKGTQTEIEFAKEGGDPTVMSFSSQQIDDFPFEDCHQILLNELIRANTVLDTPLQMPDQHTLPFNLTLVDALRFCEWAMRRMVAMCKQLGAFRSLPQCDQITLLRAGLVPLLILRGAMAFDPVNEVWRHAVLLSGDDSVGGGGPQPFMLNLNVLPATEQHYEQHKRFLLTFGEQWRTDRNVMLILQAIVLFCPQADPLMERDAIRKHRQRYCDLIMRHLKALNQNDSRSTESAYAHLMDKLDELVTLNNSFHLVYLKLNQSELEPLFREIFATK